MHIGLTKLSENNAAIADYDLEGRHCRWSQGLDWGNDKKIEEAVANAEDNKDEAEDPGEKNKRLKRVKMRQKRLSKAKKKSSPRGRKN